jgi:hypothetical protein
MFLFRLFINAPDAVTGLCRTCTWGTVRKGFRPAEAEVFCRLVGPNSRVKFPVRECSDYFDRRVRVVANDSRRYGFVTEIKLEDGSEVRFGPAKGEKESEDQPQHEPLFRKGGGAHFLFPSKQRSMQRKLLLQGVRPRRTLRMAWCRDATWHNHQNQRRTHIFAFAFRSRKSPLLHRTLDRPRDRVRILQHS